MLLIILIITSSIGITLLVGVSVILVDLYILGLIYYWNLTLNPLVVVNIIVAIGTSVDFSAHIAYAYLVEEVPEKFNNTNERIRSYKAQKALSKMGSSVFHGGFSTFAAISVIGFANNYIFVVFYRLWFGIILFGMANGFLLVPVILSLIGPTETVHEDKHESEGEVSEETISDEESEEEAESESKSQEGLSFEESPQYSNDKLGIKKSRLSDVVSESEEELEQSGPLIQLKKARTDQRLSEELQKKVFSEPRKQ